VQKICTCHANTHPMLLFQALCKFSPRVNKEIICYFSMIYRRCEKEWHQKAQNICRAGADRTIVPPLARSEDPPGRPPGKEKPPDFSGGFVSVLGGLLVVD
jgi:hypothetical protein